MASKTRVSVLHKIALIVLAAACSEGFAVGLGSAQVQSGLGQALKVTIPLLGNDSNNIKELCAKGKVETFDGALIARPQIDLGSDTQSSNLIITTTQAINEPAVALNIEIGCSSSIRRNFQILLDPVETVPTAIKAQLARQSMPFADKFQPARQIPLTDKPQMAKQPGLLTDDPMGTVQPEMVSARAASSAPMANMKEARASISKQRKSSSHARAEQGAQNQSKTSEKKYARTAKLGTRKITRNVLRLSSDDNPSESSIMLSGFKLADSISAKDNETDPQKAIEIQAAQMRFAAVMRGEDPEKNAEMEMKAAQERIQALQIEAERIKQQGMEDKRIFEEQQKKSLNINWFIGLSALLLVSLIAMAWLALRLHQTNKIQQEPFWGNDFSDEEDDDSDGSPFLDTATDLSSAASLSESEIFVESQRFHDPENDATFGKAGKGRTSHTNKFIAQIDPHSVEKDIDNSSETSSDTSPEKVGVIPRYQKRSEMLKVEEISDAMQEAEFWMSLNNSQRAINVLEQYGDSERPISPVPWLYLLELYRGTDDRTKYEALLKRFKRIFNSRMPAWDLEEEEPGMQGLEDNPILEKQISDLWGSNDVVPFLENLLFDNRGGERNGFDLPVYLDLIMLTSLAYELQPSNRFSKTELAIPE